MALFSKTTQKATKATKGRATASKAKTSKTTKSKVISGGVKTRSKKKFAFLSVVGVLALTVLGYSGYMLYQKHTYGQLAKDVQANAASIEYKYGKHFQIRDDTRYKRLLVDVYACHYNNHGNFKTISILSVRRGLITKAGYRVEYRGHSVSKTFNNWLYNMNLSRFSTVDRSGFNVMSGNLYGIATASNGYGSGSKSVKLGGAEALPACHY